MKRTDPFSKVLLTIVSILFLTSSLTAQTRTAISNGIWNDAANWDCACIPGPSEDVIIGNALTINVSGDVTINSVTVNNQAVFTSNDTLRVTEFITIAGGIKNYGIIHIAGDITNNGALEGPGIYCISGVSTNTGSILGPMDFCDLTPPVDSPWVDVPGFITGTINYCKSGMCAPIVGIEMNKLGNMKFNVAVTNGQLTILPKDANTADLSFALIDLQGRVIWQKEIKGDESSISLSEELSGIYLYRISDMNGILDQGKLLIK